MSDFSTTTATTGAHRDAASSYDGERVHTPSRRVSTETKAAYKTTEFLVFVVAVVAVLIASAVADADTDFGAKNAWLFITLLSIGYMVSRGLAKSGSRDFYDTDDH